jgi:serine/threonine protein phosphatase PrpC
MKFFLVESLYCSLFSLLQGGRATVDFVVKALHMNLEQYLKRNEDKDAKNQQQSADSSGSTANGKTESTDSAASSAQTSSSAVSAPSQSFLSEAFKQSYLATDGQLRRQNILRSGTTSVTCVVRQLPNGKRMLFTANVGDSRCVLCRGGRAVRLTIDHKASLPEEAKRITDAGGFIGRNKRVNGVLAISRALGDHMLKENDVVSAEPYCTDTELTPEDTYLLLVDFDILLLVVRSVRLL